MCAMELGQASSKLLSALEQLGNSLGSDLHSSGSSSKPSEELIKAFEEAMNAEPKLSPLDENFALETQNVPGPAHEMPNLSQVEQVLNNVAPEQNVQDISANQQVDRASANQVIDHEGHEKAIKIENTNSVSSSQKVESSSSESPQSLTQELNGFFEKLSTPNSSLTHMEMFRLQYILGMLKMQSTSGLKVSQASSQAIESVLKQNG